MEKLEVLVGTLNGRLNDPFAATMLEGAYRVLIAKDNPARLHLFALAVREMLSYLLHSWAPDEEVKACPWFQPVTQNGAPSRVQRMEYAIRGGIQSHQLPESEETVAAIIADIRDTIDELSKLTHVRPETLVMDDGEIGQTAIDTLGCFVDFLSLMEDARRELTEKLISHVGDHAFETFLGEVFNELDILSTHTRAEHGYRNLLSGNSACAGAARLCRGMPRQRRPILISHGVAKPPMEKREWTDGRIRRSRPSWNI